MLKTKKKEEALTAQAADRKHNDQFSIRLTVNKLVEGRRLEAAVRCGTETTVPAGTQVGAEDVFNLDR